MFSISTTSYRVIFLTIMPLQSPIVLRSGPCQVPKSQPSLGLFRSLFSEYKKGPRKLPMRAKQGGRFSEDYYPHSLSFTSSTRIAYRYLPNSTLISNNCKSSLISFWHQKHSVLSWLSLPPARSDLLEKLLKLRTC